MRLPAWLPGLHSGVCVWLLVASCATAIACILMFPFDFGPNGVHWLDARPGLYFDGRGIAQTAAQAGYSTVVRDISDEFNSKALAAITKSLERHAHSNNSLKNIRT